MLSLAIAFPAGRYHATPWDRHVNEGALAWPPEPLRLLRALIATWHSKVKNSGRHEQSTMHSLIEALAQELPRYILPPASHSHSRHYMPQRQTGDTSLVFDAFAAVDRNQPLYVIWPTLSLKQDEMTLLDDLLAVIGYLGRAESWVEASRVSNPGDPNCVPGDQSVDFDTGEVRGEVVSLFAPLPAADYRELRVRLQSNGGDQRALKVALPKTLLEALSVDTSVLRRQGWTQPPAAHKVSYLRPIDALRPARINRIYEAPKFTTARYVLLAHRREREGRQSTTPLPGVEDSVRIGELLRSAVMSAAASLFGEDAIPSSLSGHGLPNGNRHQHAFYLPLDSNGDGRIDRVIVHVPLGMGMRERQVLERVVRLWSAGGAQWRVVMESMGDTAAGGAVMRKATEWYSITPYLHPWYVKKGLGMEDQIRRECRERGLPEPVALERFESVCVGNGRRSLRPIQFQRFRKKRGLNQPDRRGSFWKLTFAEPVRGPLALGFGCHFGLGLFAPDTMRALSCV